jgi:hypothetical protein
VASLDQETKLVLIEQWLPRVRELRDQRKPIFIIMTCIIIVPLVATIALLLQQVLTKEIDFMKLGISGLLLGISAIPFVYLGRLQQCNDVIVAIELQVILGDREQIIKSIASISCFGKMQDLLRDIRPFLKAKAHDID